MPALLEKLVLWLEKLRYPLASTANAVALVVTLSSGIALGWSIITNPEASDALIIQSVTLSAISLILIVTLFAREASVVRRRRIASSVGAQAEAAEKLQLAWSVLTAEAESSNAVLPARRLIQEVLSLYCSIFSSITRAKCRVCIKMIEEIDGEHFVYALARDTDSAKRNRLHDKQRQEQRADPLNSNSDFLKLWSPDTPDGGHFLSNNLPKEDEYQSTSMSFFRVNPHQASERWILPYKATIVWPIRQEATLDTDLDRDRCIGFLAVDCNRTNLFLEADADIGKVLAHALYPVLDKLAERIASSAPETEETK